jgi:integrase
MPKLLDRVRRLSRLRRHSRRTEQTYVFWIKRFIHFHRLRHPAEMGPEEVTAFLSHLASERGVSASTQNQALSALLFLYREALGLQLPWLSEFERAPRTRYVPVVLSREEVRRVLAHLTGTRWLMASLLYGSGLRLMECCTLRV